MNVQNVFSHKCSLCQKDFLSRNKLLTHERNKHRNNKVIPYRTSIILPLLNMLFIIKMLLQFLLKSGLVLIDILSVQNVFQQMLFQKPFSFIYLKMNLLFDIVQYNENTFVNFKERPGKRDLNKYLIMNIEVLGKILKQKLQVMFYWLIMREFIILILVGI